MAAEATTATAAANGLPVIAPRATAGDRARAALEVILSSGFPTQFAVAVALALVGLAPFDAAGQLSARYVFALVLIDALLVVGLVLLFLRVGGEQPRAVLLGRRPVAREVLVGVALIPAVYLLAILVLGTILTYWPSLHNVSRNPLEALLRSPRDAWLLAGVTVVSGGLREEIQRGFIIHRFDRYLGGGPLGIALFSVVFGLGHHIQGWDVAITTAALGVMWGVVFLRRRSVAAAVISHAGFDVAQVLRYALYGL
jgi:membrane protease YdiL (CAAX protease family)